MRFKLRAEELFEAAIAVRPSQPFGDGKGVLLVGRSSVRLGKSCSKVHGRRSTCVSTNQGKKFGPSQTGLGSRCWSLYAVSLGDVSTNFFLFRGEVRTHAGQFHVEF